MKIKLVTILAMLFVVAWTASAQKTQNLSQAEQDVRKLERSWLDAYEKRDVALMSAIVAEDFTITFPDGSVQTKQQSSTRSSGPAARR